MNKTKQYKKTFWANDASEDAFRKWFDTNCYFNKSCTFDENKIAEFYDHTEILESQYIDVRTVTTDRNTDEAASDGADDILNMEDDGELGLDEVDEADKSKKVQGEVTFFDMVSDTCK